VLKAVAHLSDGTTQDVTSGTQWTLSNTAMATMANGTLTAKAPGSVTVQAAYVEATPAGTSPSSSSSTPQNLSASTQVTITTSPSTNTPTISWSAPAAISYGTALSSMQLNATASVAGTFTYTPAAGAVLKAGTQTLTVAFTPTDTTYSAATATVQLTVNQAAPAITWAPLAAITQGTALSSAQLDATANVPGAFAYNPAAGNVPAAGTLQLTATFTPTDTTDYAAATAKNTLLVNSSSNAPKTNGTTCPIASGASQATIQSTLNSCGSGNTVVFAAGSYNVSNTLSWPCGVSISSPTATFGSSKPVTINWTGSGAAFSYPSSCTVTGVVFQGIEVAASPGSNVPGGSAINLGNGGGVGPTIQYNYLHGVQAPTTISYSEMMQKFISMERVRLREIVFGLV
jgi:hypothetical protein